MNGLTEIKILNVFFNKLNNQSILKDIIVDKTSYLSFKCSVILNKKKHFFINLNNSIKKKLLICFE